jgi:hypothetical protein
MDRRTFIHTTVQSLLAMGLIANSARASHPQDKRPIQFVFAQVRYRGGDWNPHPLAVTPLMEELMLRTSVEAPTLRHEITLADRDLFSYPFLYMTGRYEFEPFPQREIEILRQFLSFGGFLLIDDALGQLLDFLHDPLRVAGGGLDGRLPRSQYPSPSDVGSGRPRPLGAPRTGVIRPGVPTSGP